MGTFFHSTYLPNLEKCPRKSRMKRGKVYIVGAGPGDIGLFTLKGSECIQKADCIIYDYLANERLLRFASEGAERIYVGKKGRQHTLEQPDINRLLIKKARSGKIVVRLKGGDPFIFGRGSEEALALADAKVDFEVVPGVTSASAAPCYAGIPLTHRKVTSTVAFVTGNEDQSKPDSDIDWYALSKIGTLVFLMGVGQLPNIVKRLIYAGKPPLSPAAIVRWGTKPEQKVLVGTLSDIVKKAARAKFAPPAVIVVGDVVKLRRRLSWFERKPLFGRNILVTRTHTQASQLISKLTELGANAIELPTIEIKPPSSFSPLDNAIKKLSGYDWIVFTSVNGVESFFGRLFKNGKDARDLKGIGLCAIGPRTAERLKIYNTTCDCVPKEYVSEAVIEELRNFDLEGKRILIPRAQLARDVLPRSLEAAGAKVEVVEAYRTARPPLERDTLERLLSAEIDIVTFTSSSCVKNFFGLLGRARAGKVLKRAKIASIGPITSKTVRDFGRRVDIEAKKYTIDGLVEAIIKKI